jgi:hypothetical protein
MNSAACRNQIEIRRAGRYIKRSQREVAAKDGGPDARCGWDALVNAATARQGSSQASNARPAAEQTRTDALTLRQATRTYTVRATHRLPSIASGSQDDVRRRAYEGQC